MSPEDLHDDAQLEAGEPITDPDAGLEAGPVCRRCGEPLGTVAKAARSPVCEVCALEAGELT